MSRYEDKRMILIATDYHEGLGRAHEAWVDEWIAQILLAGTTTIDDYTGLDKLRLAFPLLTRSGKKTMWHVKAGPLTLAELDERYPIEMTNDEPDSPIEP